MFLHFNKELVKSSFVDLFDNSSSFLGLFDRAFNFTSSKFRGVVSFHSERHLWENLFTLQQTLLFASKSNNLESITFNSILFARTLTIAILFRNCVYMTSYNEANNTQTIYPGNIEASTQCALASLREYDPTNSLEINIGLLTLCLNQKLDYSGSVEQILFQYIFDLSHKFYGIPIMPKYDDKYCYQGIASRLNLELELYLADSNSETLIERLQSMQISEEFADSLYDKTVDNYYRYLVNDALRYVEQKLKNSYLVEFIDFCKLFELYQNQSMKIIASAIRSIDSFSASQKRTFITKVKNTHLLNHQLNNSM